MTLSIQEISDRLEIGDLIVDYAHAIDSGDWDTLDDIFTPDAVVDYTAMGGIRGDLAAIKAFLPEGLGWFRSTQHLVATSKITVTGDEATGRTICANALVLAEPGGERTIQLGLWYVDTFVRTPQGWRISSRVEERSYAHNTPDGFPA